MRYILLAFLLGGCATTHTPQQIAQQQEQNTKNSQAFADYLRARYGPVCEHLGLERESKAWIMCIICNATSC